MPILGSKQQMSDLEEKIEQVPDTEGKIKCQVLRGK